MISHTLFEQCAFLTKDLYVFSYTIQVRCHFEKDLYVFSYTIKQSDFSWQTGPKQNRIGQFR